MLPGGGGESPQYSRRLAARASRRDAARAAVARWAPARVTVVKAGWLQQAVVQRLPPPSFSLVRRWGLARLTVIIAYCSLGAYKDETVTSGLTSTVPPSERLRIGQAGDPESVARLHRLAVGHPARRSAWCAARTAAWRPQGTPAQPLRTGSGPLWMRVTNCTPQSLRRHGPCWRRLQGEDGGWVDGWVWGPSRGVAT